MSEKVARAHTSQSNRAKARGGADRKVVFKSVVENPFQVQWPSVPMNIQNAILACVVDMLGGVAEYNLSREQKSRKRKRSRAPQGERASKKAKLNAIDTQEPASEEASALETSSTEIRSPAAPSVLSSVTVGINEVTRELESIVHSNRSIVTANVEGAKDPALCDPKPSPCRVVIACRADVDPPILLGHLPNLIAACNSVRKRSDAGFTQSSRTWLVPMHKGAEHTLAEAFGLRRVSVLLIEDSAPTFPSLVSLLQNIPHPSAPWLSPSTADHKVTLVPTHIKQLRTSAPKDMKAAKEKRAKERAVAKERRGNRRRTIPRVVTISTAD